jgi:DNA-binding transcriptional LysR family regulator
LLPPTLRLFHDSHPNIRVQLHDLAGGETFDGLRSGELDVALTVQGLPKTWPA